MLNTMLWGAIFRIVEAASQAAPSLLCGLLVAGIFRRLLGPANTRRLFGSNTWRSLPQAWALGMLLPVCSLGDDSDHQRTSSLRHLGRRYPGLCAGRPAVQSAVVALRHDTFRADGHFVLRIRIVGCDLRFSESPGIECSRQSLNRNPTRRRSPPV